jgi:hypothetical protein
MSTSNVQRFHLVQRSLAAQNYLKYLPALKHQIVFATVQILARQPIALNALTIALNAPMTVLSVATS